MSDQAPNKQLLHLVLGGELLHIDDVEFKDLSKVDVVGSSRTMRPPMALARKHSRPWTTQMLFHRASASPARFELPGCTLSFADPHAVVTAIGARALGRRPGIPAAEYLRFVHRQSRTVTVPGDIYERAGGPPILAMWHGQHFRPLRGG
jgi:hypothetical protein